MLIAGVARIPVAVLLTMITLTQVTTKWRNHFRLLAGVLYPFISILFCYLMLRSTCRTLRDGGVRWRDTFYPLAELRAGMIEWHPLGGLFRARR